MFNWILLILAVGVMVAGVSCMIAGVAAMREALSPVARESERKYEVTMDAGIPNSSNSKIWLLCSLFLLFVVVKLANNSTKTYGEVARSVKAAAELDEQESKALAKAKEAREEAKEARDDAKDAREEVEEARKEAEKSIQARGTAEEPEAARRAREARRQAEESRRQAQESRRQAQETRREAQEAKTEFLKAQEAKKKAEEREAKKKKEQAGEKAREKIPDQQFKKVRNEMTVLGGSWACGTSTKGTGAEVFSKERDFTVLI